MTKPRPYQVRIFLKEEFAQAVRHHGIPVEMKPLMDVLARHHAALDHNQMDEFSSFLKSVDKHPEVMDKGSIKSLYDLTKNSLANPEKRGYFAREFTLSVNGKIRFVGDQGNALIADLRKLGNGDILASGKAFRDGKDKNVGTVRKTYFPKHHPGT